MSFHPGQGPTFLNAGGMRAPRLPKVVKEIKRKVRDRDQFGDKIRNQIPKDDIITIGDELLCRGSFGAGDPKWVKIVGMELTDKPRSKSGTPVDSVCWDRVIENRVVFDLGNGCWAYSEQIDSWR